jgi:predicted phosphohydrolase
MKIQIASDLHLEFQENKNYILQNPLDHTGDILILSGDVIPFYLFEKQPYALDFLADQFEMIYWIPGNHEYYNYDIQDKDDPLIERIKTNLHLVNNVSMIYETSKLIFSTLWSNIHSAFSWQIEKSLNDFHQIKYNGFRLSADRYNEKHKSCMKFISQELNDQQQTNKIVFTHHVPTFLNYPEQYKNNVLSEAFATELHEFIESNQPSHWVYGHHHQNIPDFMIGKTKLLTNQLGYVQNKENKNFDGGKCIEI